MNRIVISVALCCGTLSLHAEEVKLAYKLKAGETIRTIVAVDRIRLGEVTAENLDKVRGADGVVREEIRRAGLERETWQAFCVLLADTRTVGVMGDGRTYENVVALRAVQTTDFMTADWAPLPHELLARVSNRIINEVRGINRVTYDISSKPPATIEWE